MFQIPLEYYKNETVHRNICNDKYNGIITCGFLNKRIKVSSDTNIIFDYYGALLLLSGSGVHVDSEGREFNLYPGCFIQRIPGKVHSTYVNPDGEWLEFFICFGRGIYEALEKIHLLNSEQDVLYPGVNMAIFDMFVKFMYSLKNAAQEELPMLLSEAQKIIFTLYQMNLTNSSKDKNSEIIKQACQIFSLTPEGRISPQEVSMKLGVGYEMFRKMFKKKMGISPTEFIIQNRINAAKSMLIDTNCSIKEVAIKLGFSDSFTFSKQFKKFAGISPGEFRRRH